MLMITIYGIHVQPYYICVWVCDYESSTYDMYSVLLDILNCII